LQLESNKLVTIVATVHNLGTAAASNVPVRISVDGTQLSQPTIPFIAPGSYARASAQWDTRGVKGDHTVGATADPANTIAESDEGNNTAGIVVTVKSKK